MSQDPREIFRKLVNQRGRGPGPQKVAGGVVGFVLLVGGVVTINNALFNGKSHPYAILDPH